MSKIKICLDAGHYGKYNQSPAVKSYYESDMNWKLHLLLKKYLEEYGVAVVLTRSKQATDMGLKARGMASKGCDLFLSIHSNAVGREVNESIDYPVVYVPLNGSGDKIGKKLAECIASTMGTTQKGKAVSRKGSGNWDYYGVINGAVAVGTPGLILEHSFHTNTKMTKWLLDDSNLDKLAQAEAKVLADYYGLKKASQETAQKPVTMVIKKGSVVSLDVDAVYYNGKTIPSWVKAEKWIVKDVNGDRVVIDKSLSGKYSICSPVKAEYLNVVDTSSPGATAEKMYPNEKADYADSFATSKAGLYKVNADDGLYLRAGASTKKKAIELMKNGSHVRCYGYYTKEWLYVVSDSGKKGFCHSSYLKRI